MLAGIWPAEKHVGILVCRVLVSVSFICCYFLRIITLVSVRVSSFQLLKPMFIPSCYTAPVMFILIIFKISPKNIWYFGRTPWHVEQHTQDEKNCVRRPLVSMANLTHYYLPVNKQDQLFISVIFCFPGACNSEGTAPTIFLILGVLNMSRCPSKISYKNLEFLHAATCLRWLAQWFPTDFQDV